MAVLRIQKREIPYVQIDRETLRDTSISLKARGLWCICISYPDDWEFNLQHLSTISECDGKHAVRTALKELEAAGLAYLERVQNEDGTFAGSTWVLLERPELRPTGDSEDLTEMQVFPTSGKSDGGKTRRPENPDVGKIARNGIKNKDDGSFKKNSTRERTRARKSDSGNDPVSILCNTWNVRPSPYQRDKIAATVDDLGRWRELVERFALEAKTQRRCIAWLIDDYENPKPTQSGEADEKPKDAAEQFEHDYNLILSALTD